jgi:hypothetical protein
MNDFTAPQYQPHHFAPPPRKPRTWRNLMLGLLVVFGVLIVGGTIASVSTQTPATDAGKVVRPSTQPTGKTGTKRDTRLDRNQPATVTVGQAVTKGRHRLEAGWAVRSEPYIETFQAVGVQLTNVSDQASAAFIDIKLYKGSRLLGEISCSTPDIEPGETADGNCFSSAKYAKGWTRVTVAAAF